MAEKNPFPSRIRVRAESGALQSLPDEPESFALLRRGDLRQAGLCLLGVGADPAAAARAAEALLGQPVDGPVYWMESPDLVRQIGQVPQIDVPAHWIRVTAPPENTACVFFQPGLRLFPSFWGPILGSLRAAALEKKKTPGSSVILPGDEKSLLTAELAAAFAAHGLSPLVAAPDRLADALPELIERNPALLFAVNGRGLDSAGEIFHTLRELGIPTHIWFVDNPWHVLSALRAPWWKAARLWVTDDSFLPSLQASGAEDAGHLPLAAWPERFANPAPLQTAAPLAPIVFVGRSAFPDKAAYFAGQRVPSQLFAQALAALGSERPPDFFWWAHQLGIQEFWPGRAVRQVGFAAEECSQAWRVRCLRACPELTVFGDDGWREILPEDADIRPPVDYYTSLPGLYAAARYSLNVTSLLLPAGLTQRHFDTWTADGVCLTSASPGLAIFPEELTRPVTFRHPDEIPKLIDNLEKTPGLRASLMHDWQSELKARHSYAHRVERVLAS